MEYLNLRRTAYGSGYDPYGSSDERYLMRMFLAAGGVAGTIIMPVVIWKWMRRMNRWDFWRWLLMMVAVGGFHIFVTAMGTKSSPKMTWANYVFPSGAFLVEVSARPQVYSKFEETEPLVVDTRKLSPRERNLQDDRRSREQDQLGKSLRIQHSIAASISCVLWLGLGLWVAFRELRVTDRAWRELA